MYLIKTTLFAETDFKAVYQWIEKTIELTSLNKSISDNNLPDIQLIRNLDRRNTWPIRKTIQIILDHLCTLTIKQQMLARCILLKSSQWALDCRMEVPNSIDFRQHILEDATEIIKGSKAYKEAVVRINQKYNINNSSHVLCLNRSVIGIESEFLLRRYKSPKLILTSPPYPGVHILYHRWQIQGRRESPAPFWITNTTDGCGASFYTFGDREQKELTSYYQMTLDAFTSLAKISNKKTLVVQLIAFSNPSWQLNKYLETMERAGFREIIMSSLSKSRDGRIRRSIPNRKWYANEDRSSATSHEFVLFHMLR